MGHFIMKKIVLIFSLLPLTVFAATDAEIALDNAIGTVRTNCSGVSAKMESIKKMAGIGTAVNAAGTVAGAAGVASGVVKLKKHDLATARAIGGELGVVHVKTETDILLKKLKGENLSVEENTFLESYPEFKTELESRVKQISESANKEEKIKELEKESFELEKEVQQQKSAVNRKQDESVAAGNIRTGTFAVDTVTNVAGAIVSSKTVVDDDFIEQIKKCTESIDALRTARTRMNMEDGPNANQQKMELSQKILDKCSEYEYVNLTPLNNLAKGAMVTNSIGAATGTAATITSVLGNNKRLSDMNFKNDPEDVIKYAKMNTASNVLGGVTAAASLTGTVLNASQIKTAKQVLNIAQECESVLTY